MPRAKNQDLIKKTLNLRAGDWEKLSELFPKHGPSIAVRKVVSAFVDKHYTETTVDVPSTDLDL